MLFELAAFLGSVGFLIMSLGLGEYFWQRGRAIQDERRFCYSEGDKPEPGKG